MEQHQKLNHSNEFQLSHMPAIRMLTVLFDNNVVRVFLKIMFCSFLLLLRKTIWIYDDYLTINDCK